jgi:hypothetical protein
VVTDKLFGWLINRLRRCSVDVFFAADKPAAAVLLKEKNTVSWLMSCADKF